MRAPIHHARAADLIVDDHAGIRDALAAYLAREGMRTRTARDAAEARSLIEELEPDLLVLDVMMPGEDGFSLCEHVRSHGRVPVIFLTAANELSQRVAGLEIGADDYLTKPFEPIELLARIRTVLRRSGEPGPRRRTRRRLAFDRWILDMDRRELVDTDGVSLPLSAAEFRLLSVLVQRPQVVLTRDQLLDLTQGRNAHSFDRSIDNQVSRLRKKIESDPREPCLIRTVWGGGYVFDSQPRDVE
jgi:two-component system OmpR family response regulator